MYAFPLKRFFRTKQAPEPYMQESVSYGLYCVFPLNLVRGLLAIRRSGSPIGNQFQHRTMIHDGGICHTKTITIYGTSIYYSVGPKYRIIAFISACTYKSSVIGNVIQSVF